MHTDTHAYRHMHTDTYKHTHTYRHIHTDTQTHIQPHIHIQQNGRRNSDDSTLSDVLDTKPSPLLLQAL